MIFVDIKKYQQVGPSIKRSVDIVGTLKLLNVFFRANLTVLSRHISSIPTGAAKSCICGSSAQVSSEYDSIAATADKKMGMKSSCVFFVCSVPHS